MSSSLYSLYAAAIPVLIILRLAWTTFAHPSKGPKQSSKRKSRTMSFIVKWGRERLHFPLPPPTTPLGVIRKDLENYTHLTPGTYKLIHAGAVMKDDNVPIQQYGIRNGSTIVILGSAEKPFDDKKLRSVHNKPAPPPARTQDITISSIHAELEKVRTTLLPAVDLLLRSIGVSGLQEIPLEPPPGYAPAPSTDQEHTRLAELLLQSLLRLDAVTLDMSWEEARKERKGAVREVQGLLDTLDSGWKNRQSIA